MASEKKNPTKQKSNGKTRIDELRNAAFSFSICDHENDSSKITAVFEIDSKLYALTENYLWHIETPYGIDPERIHPEAKGATHKIFSTGSKNPTISRTLLQAKRLLDSILLKNKLSKQRILSVYFKFVSNIVFSYDIYDSLVSEFLSHAKMFSEIPKKITKQKIIPSIPQIIKLESRIQSFFSHCHKEIKHLVDLTRVFDSQISKSKIPYFILIG